MTLHKLVRASLATAFSALALATPGSAMYAATAAPAPKRGACHPGHG